MRFRMYTTQRLMQSNTVRFPELKFPHMYLPCTLRRPDPVNETAPLSPVAEHPPIYTSTPSRQTSMLSIYEQTT